ncbi:MAG TPA: tetratricopeptide repeat protein, partial [Phycisphaerales bacterium]|nr:tetratricopeptide repeat protein [Phycisphaerales bacterium]
TGMPDAPLRHDGAPPLSRGIDIRDRPGGILHLRAMEAYDDGDYEVAIAIWRDVIDGDYHLLDRLFASRNMANTLKLLGRSSEAIPLLRDAIEEFRSQASTLSPDGPLDTTMAWVAKNCAHLLEIIDPSFNQVFVADLVLDHRALFERSEVHEAMLIRAMEWGWAGGRDADVIAQVEESWLIEEPGDQRSTMWARVQTFYARSLMRAGRRAEAADHMGRVWEQAKGHGHEHVRAVGPSLVEAFRAARRHDDAIDATWEIIAMYDSFLAAPGLGDYDRRSLEDSRRSLLNQISASGTYGRPVDSLLAIRRLKDVEHENPDVLRSLDIAEEMALREIEQSGSGGGAGTRAGDGERGGGG